MRRATLADYSAITRLHNDYYGIGWPMTEAALRSLDRPPTLGYESTPPRIVQRWVVQRAATPVATALVRWTQLPDPHRYEINFVIDPGLDESSPLDKLRHQLLDQMLRWINLRPRQQRAHDLRSHARADRTADIDFWSAHGFVEFLREQDSLLDVAGFDHTPYRNLSDSLAAHDINIVAFDTLPQGPTTEHALYDLEQELRRDVPGWSGKDFYTFAEWRTVRLEAAEFLPAACFIAIQGETWIGLSYLTAQADADFLLQRLTGVRSCFRRRGVASALKLRGVDYARAHGYAQICTSNAMDNAAMRTLNDQLGFVPQPVWVHFKKPMIVLAP